MDIISIPRTREEALANLAANRRFEKESRERRAWRAGMRQHRTGRAGVPCAGVPTGGISCDTENASRG